MKKINIDKAKLKLEEAMRNASFIDDNIGHNIDRILNGTHKTYKYVLMTALLAEVVENNIDMLTLQAGADSEGAYDARTLCHKAVVPFEREYFPDCLGGSNEPFLNKPARFEKLSKDNAVRKGKHNLMNELWLQKLVWAGIGAYLRASLGFSCDSLSAAL